MDHPDATALDTDDTNTDTYLGDLKPEINEFLWGRLPDWLTLKDAERVAVEIYDRIASLHRNPPESHLP